MIFDHTCLRQNSSLRKSCRTWIKNLRDELIANGKVANSVFTEDVSLKSPSAAASLMAGGEMNGLTSWKNSSGVTLKKIIK